MQDIQIVVESTFLPGLNVPRVKGGAVVVFDEAQLDALGTFGGKRPFSHATKCTLFNGHAARLPRLWPTSNDTELQPVVVQAVISGDRRQVRIDLLSGSGSEQLRISHSVPDGKTLAVPSDRGTLLIRPRLVVQEEEEKLLGAPSGPQQNETPARLDEAQHKRDSRRTE